MDWNSNTGLPFCSPWTIQFPLVNQRNTSAQPLNLTILQLHGMTGIYWGVSLWGGFQTDMSLDLMKLTVQTTTSVTLSIFKGLQRDASWYKIQWKVQKTHPPFVVCTCSPNFFHNTCFFPDRCWCIMCSQADSAGAVHSNIFLRLFQR